MLSVRRWYIYLVSAISLQSVTWAVIFLLRNLIIPEHDASTLELAFFIAVIIIGLPIFLAHWFWAQRLANSDPEERGATLRRAYLYGMMAAFLIPMIANIDGLVGALLRLVFDVAPPRYYYFDLSPKNDLLNSIIAVVVLGLLWFYHWRTAAADAKEAPEVEELAIVRRLYVYTFTSAGLIMTVAASKNLLMWIMFEIWGGIGDLGPGSDVYQVEEFARLAVGLPLWLVFWSWAQRLFRGDSEEEIASALRKLYLYLTVFLSAIYAVFTITMLVSDLFRQLLDVPSLGGPGSVRGPISTILVTGAVWAYHTYVLRQDMLAADEGPRQAQIRRLYYYLMAAIGLAAFLVGLAGNTSVLIDGLSENGFARHLRDQASWFTAAVLIGLPVWLIPWRRSQTVAISAGSDGEAERRSIVRKIYLYFFLFVAAMTTLGYAVYLVAQIVNLALGGREATGLLGDLAQAIAFTLIAVAVWVYHSFVLRADGRMDKAEQSERLSSLIVAVLDGGEGQLGPSLIEEISREMPDLILRPVGFGEPPAETLGDDLEEEQAKVLAESDIIVGPWTMTSAQGDNTDFAAAVSSSKARKLLIPTWEHGYEWAGVDHWKHETLVRQTVHALKQLVTGDEIQPLRPLGGPAIALIVIGVLILAGISTALIAALGPWS